jgi:glycosyltransferase involved in cell wall biosynthesis
VFNIIKNKFIKNKLKYKTGVIITAHNNWDHVQRAIESALKYIPKPHKILVYDNESTDPNILLIPKKYSDITYIRIDDQIANGGLTGTWDQGTKYLIKDKCDVILFQNHDVELTESIINLLDMAYKEDALASYGPLTNKCGYREQVAIGPSEGFTITDGVRPAHPINGFCWAATTKTLEANRFNEHCYFDPKRPFRGNDNRWFNLMKKKGGHGVIVHSAWVKHAHLREWGEIDKLAR